MPSLPRSALDQLFFDAHSFAHFLPREVDDATLLELADMAKLGPTSLNSCPARFVFVKSREAKERLRPHLSSGNVEKTMAAPVTAVIAYDLEFYEKFAKLSPGRNSRDGFASNAAHAEHTAILNATLQAGWLIMAARALGLDAGPMGGFRNAGVDEAFFRETPLRSLVLCNFGYADRGMARARGPRLDFEEFCTIV
jgi:3-hydroxypropanoate dehydrogenase